MHVINYMKILATLPFPKKFPAFYGTRKFIIVFKRARHWSPFSTRWIQFILSYHISLRSILILSTHLPISKECISSGFATKALSHSCYMPRSSYFHWFDPSNNLVRIANVSPDVIQLKWTVSQSHKPVYNQWAKNDLPL